MSVAQQWIAAAEKTHDHLTEAVTIMDCPSLNPQKTLKDL
jgi:hypothetical protein